MEILKQLETKVKSAIKEIGELRDKVQELEEIKARYELKTQEMLEEIELLDLLEASEAEENEASDAQESSDSTQPSESGSNIFSPSL